MKALGILSIFQIILLITSVVAISYILGGSFKIVSAQKVGVDCFSVGGESWRYIGGNNWVCERGHSCERVTKTNGQLCEDVYPDQNLCETRGGQSGFFIKENRISACGTSPSGEAPDTGIPKVGLPPLAIAAVTPIVKATEALKAGELDLTNIPEIEVPKVGDEKSGAEEVAKKAGGFFSGIFATRKLGLKNILGNAAIAAALYTYATPALEKLGIPPHWARATGNAITAGYTAKSVVLPLIDKIFGWSLATGPSGWVIGGAIFLIIFLLSF